MKRMADLLKRYLCNSLKINKMKRFITFSFTFTIFILSVASQAQSSVSSVTIKGIVVDSVSKETIPFATVSAFSNKMPQTAVKRVAADADGKFEMTMTASAPFMLKVEAVGMKAAVQNISDFSKKTIDLGKIALSANAKMLSEVTVMATKPLVKVDLDKITYDMKSDPESQTSNALDMLRKVPMVTVDGDENIKVKGQSNFKIFMNGKATNLISNNPSQVLKSIPANTIKSIEVITEPGAKYEAEGLAGIINIVMESAMKGYTGTVRASVDNYGSVNGGIYFSTKVGKWGITANLNDGMYQQPGLTTTTNRESYTSTDFRNLYQKNKGKSSGDFRYGSLSLSYEIDSLDLITLSGNGFGGGYRTNTKGSTSILSVANDTTQAYRNDFDVKGIWGGYDGSIDYQRSFKKPDKLITTSYKISYSPGGSDNYTDITNIKNYFDKYQHIKSNSSGTEHTFQLDYTEPFNKKHIVEAGMKYIYRINQSNNEYLDWNYDTETWMPTPGINDSGIHYTYGILGVYGSYTYKMNKFSFRAGGRLENTNGKITLNNDSSYNPKPYTNIVPSVTFSYQPKPMTSIQLSYTQRISRPDIYYLNPFKNITDPTNISQGNPNLNPEISHSFNLNYNLFKQKFNFNGSLFTSFANNSIEEINLLQDSILYRTYENIGHKRNAGISIYFRWQATKSLNVYFNGNGNYAYYYYQLNDQTIKNDGFNFSTFLGGSYNLPKDMRVNLNCGYSSPQVSLQSKNYGFYYYQLSLNKSLLKKKLNMTIYGNGFLERYFTYKNVTTTDAFRSESVMKRDSPRFGISVSYTFGQMKERIQTAKRSIQNDDLKKGNSGDQTGAQGGTTTGSAQ